MTKTKGKIFIGTDHAGFPLKEPLLPRWKPQFPELDFEDVGCFNTASVHYPEFAAIVARKVIEGSARGILICGTGIGMAIAANKIAGIRAAIVWDVTSARLSREHNDSNIICLGARLLGPEVVFEAVSAWLTTPFSAGRHQKRIEMIRQLEGERHS